jgi:hypothetical protein
LKEEITHQNTTPEEEEKLPVLFPAIFEIESLKNDLHLPLLSLNILQENVPNLVKFLDISVSLPSPVKRADIFLTKNKLKLDMFYQVSFGKFIFRNIKLKTGENHFEFFYRVGNRKSTTVHTIIYRKYAGEK